MGHDYTIGDIVLASDIALSTKGEIVQLVNGKTINPAGYCFQWAKSSGKPGLWMPIASIIRHATTKEIIEFAGEQKSVIQREIDYHQQQLKILTERLEYIQAASRKDES